MKTQNMLATTLVTSALFAGVSTAQAQGPLRSDKITGTQVEKGYIQPNRKAITNKNLNLLPLKLQPVEKTLNKVGFTLANAKDVWTAAPKIDAAALAAQFTANQGAPIYQNQSAGNTIYDTLSKDWEAGDKSWAWAQATFNMTHAANEDMASLQGDAQINGALFGDSANLAEATANFYAPLTGTQSASMNLTLLGQTIWSKTDSGATSATINDGYTWNGKLWQLGFDLTVGGFGIDAEIWVQGSAGAAFVGSCVPNKVSVTADTNANLSVGGRVSADLIIVGAELDANLTLADIEFISTASTSSTIIKTPLYNTLTHTISYVNTPVMNVNRNITADLDLIEGYLLGKITDPIFGDTIAQHYFVNDPDGIYQWSGVLDNYSKMYFLQ